MATFTWTSTSGGDWNTASNWSPAIVPNSTTADVLVNSPGSYQITIASGARDTVQSLEMDAGAGTLEVDGTLDFSGSSGTITGDLQSIIAMNGGTIINGGTMNPAFVVDGSA